jgi:hypothetical protein
MNTTIFSGPGKDTGKSFQKENPEVTQLPGL